MTNSKARICIVGAGIIGLSIAFELLARGKRVQILEGGTGRTNASFAAGGMLAPGSEALESEQFDRADYLLGRESLQLWPTFTRQISNVANSPLTAHMTGTRVYGLNPALVDSRLAKLACGAAYIDDDGVVVLPDEGHVDPRDVMNCLHSAVRQLGGAIRLGCEVVDIQPGPSACVQLADGTTINDLDHVVIASGWAAARFDQFERLRNIEPVKGQMQMLKLSRPIGHEEPVGRGHGVYIIPRDCEHIVVGATVEPGRTDLETDQDALLAMRSQAVKLDPRLRGAELVDQWAGIRPFAQSPAPIIEQIAPQIFAAVGHHRNGVLLAPVTAKRIVELLEAGETAAGGTPFTQSRA